MKIDLPEFIEHLRKSDEYLQYIYTEGSCYKFYELLNKLFDGVVAYKNEGRSHVVSLYKGKYYDITGDVTDDEEYFICDRIDHEYMKKWSFYENNHLKVGECENCNEPILFYPSLDNEIGIRREKIC